MSNIKHSTPNTPNLSENQLQYLRILSPEQHQYVVDAWQALINRKTDSHDLDGNDPSPPTQRPLQEDMGLACDKCYDAICQNRVIESHIGTTIDQIVHRIYDSPYHNEVEDIRDAVEQMIRLASRMIKGTPPCVLASEARCHNQGSADIHRKFVDGIQKVVDAGMDLELDWELSTKATFSLDKLCQLSWAGYTTLEDIHRRQDNARGQGIQEQLEEMWCHGSCHCWDGDCVSCGDSTYMDRHYKHCPLRRY
jgi:hypothetical protein